MEAVKGHLRFVKQFLSYLLIGFTYLLIQTYVYHN